MKLQTERDVEFLERQKKTRESRLGKMTELLCRFVTDSFAEDQVMLQEELGKALGLLESEAGRHMDDIPGYDKFYQYILDCGLEGFINKRIEETVSVFEEKKVQCAEAVYGLIPEIYVDYHPVKGAPEEAKVSIQKLAGAELPCRQELEEIQEKTAQAEEEIRRSEQERQETEAGFQSLMRQNAAERAELEKEKPEIRYSTREIRREGFLGFLKDLFGKVQTETIADDSELREWQEKVDRIQEGYDARAREWNDRLEAVKEKQKEQEERVGCLCRERLETEEKIRNILQEEVQKTLKDCLYGEGGLAGRMKAALERDMEQNADEIRKLAEKACREWHLG